ncbi:MAG: hypothetical protein R3F56_14705 [Planctomycetota bacterium]
MPSPSVGRSLIVAGLAMSGAAVAVASLESPPAPPAPTGHLILQVEGDAAALHVTRITKKADPCGVARTASHYTIVVRDAGGRELSRTPLDLSAFDLDPARIGGALRVEGCVVKDPHVATLASVPCWPTASSLEILAGNVRLGELTAARYAQLVAAGERR